MEGVLIASKEEVKKLIDSKIEVYFGEALGKHSEVMGVIYKNDMKFVTDDSATVALFEKYHLSSGHNPFNYRSIVFNLESIGLDEDDDTTVRQIIDKMLEGTSKSKITAQ